jgi:hypothetical protein
MTSHWASSTENPVTLIWIGFPVYFIDLALQEHAATQLCQVKEHTPYPLC